MKLPAWCLAAVLLATPVVSAGGELEDSYQRLQDAVAQKDASRVLKLVAEIYPLACEMASASEPAEAGEKAVWKSHVDYAKSIESYTEYALYSTAIQSPAAALVQLIGALERQNPKSKYLDEAYGPYLVALNQTGAGARVTAIAEKALSNFPENEDLLLLLADAALAKNPDRALALANRLTAALNRHGKPANIAGADWERKKTAGLGRGYWIAGVVYGAKDQYVNADRSLRASLPLIQGQNAMTGPALFYLGMANYNLGKMTANKARVLEAAKFSEQCAAIAGPYSDQARHNALVMKAEAAKMR